MTVSQGPARRGPARPGGARPGKAGVACDLERTSRGAFGDAHGVTRKARRGTARHGAAGRGKAGAVYGTRNRSGAEPHNTPHNEKGTRSD